MTAHPLHPLAAARWLTSAKLDAAEAVRGGAAVLTVGEDIAVAQRAQAIAATDHRALIQAQRELAAAGAEIKLLLRRRPST
ncbi:MAG TPA: hypothetical protein VF516_10430 [Kofleriaceae bacterium]